MTTRSRSSGRGAGFSPRVVPAGDAAQMLELAEDLDLEANAAAQRVAEALRSAGLAGVTDIVPAIATVTVHFEAAGADQTRRLRDEITRRLLAALADAAEATAERERPPVEIPVCYDEAYAPDLAEVATATGLLPAQVVQRHVASPHRVLMMGFAPGFPYIGGLDARLAGVPRRATPRPRLAAGSVAIANGQTAVYPFATPGGWNIIGRTPLRLFDPGRVPASLLQAGDRVAFVPIPADEYERRATGDGVR